MARIAQVDLWRIDYPVVGRFKFLPATGDRRPLRHTVVVRVCDDAGQAGWGQSVPAPRWSYETPETVESTLRNYLAPAVIGLDTDDFAGLHARMNREIAGSFSTGQPIAKAALDLALWDLVGRQRGESIAGLWGRQPAPTVELSWTLNPDTLAEIDEEIARAAALGYRSFHLKLGPDPVIDVERARHLRRQVPEAFLWGDANGGYDEPAALHAAPRLADLGFAALEQPLPPNRLTGFRRLKRLGALPILMDEPIVSRTDLEEFLRLDLLDGVVMKSARTAGLTEARAILDLVEQEELYWLGSGLTDPDLSLAASLHLFAAYGLSRPAALNGPQYLAGSLLTDPWQPQNAHLTVPTGPGLGVEVDCDTFGGLQA